MNVFHYLAVTGNRGVDKIGIRLKRMGSPGMALSCPVFPVFSENTLEIYTNVKLSRHLDLLPKVVVATVMGHPVNLGS